MLALNMNTLFDLPASHTPTKTIRILVYPNITYAKDLTKDSFVIYLATAIRQLNRLRDDLFFYILMPERLSVLEFPNTQQLIMPLSTHAPAMRVHFDVPAIQKLLSKNIDIDLVWSHLPEHTHALAATLSNVTHHRPHIFGYAHWFDLNSVATWEGGSFRENVSGLLHMDRCYLNTNAQKTLVLREAAQTFTSAIVQQLDRILIAQPPGVSVNDVTSHIDTQTEKLIVFNHRPAPYKDYPTFLKIVRQLRLARQDFQVWIPLLDTSPEPWITRETFTDKAEYYAKLRSCRVGLSPKQLYAGWSIATTDGLMNGCPYITYDADYYQELDPLAERFQTVEDAVRLLHRYLDDMTHRNTHAERARQHALTALDDRLAMEDVSEYITASLQSMAPRQSPRAAELVALIQQHGSLTKEQLMKDYLNWGRGIPFTPYRRALLSHPHIYDIMGAVPTYQWHPSVD